MKKVLIITYYWPPMGGGGVQRWLKFTKYLREFGWEPVIYTTDGADLSNPDHALLEEVPEGIEVIRRPIWEPYDLYRLATGKSKKEKIQPGFLQEGKSNAFTQKISLWIRGNFFIPDAKMFWIKPSAKFLINYLKSNKVDAVISTGPPHTNHLIALRIKRKLNIKWLADFRDPWTNIDFYDKLMLTPIADGIHHRLERKVINSADEVVTVSWSWARDFEESCGRPFEVVTNGFDPADFEAEGEVAIDKDLVIAHIGSMNPDRNPFILWDALAQIIDRQPEIRERIKVKLIGPTDFEVFDYAEKKGLRDRIEHIAHLPHKEVMRHLQHTPYLLLPLNNTPNIDGVIPGKLYEYMAANRPIICIGKPDGDAARIIKESNSGKVFDFDDEAGLLKYLEEAIGRLDNSNAVEEERRIDQFSRRSLAGNMAALLDRMI